VNAIVARTPDLLGGDEGLAFLTVGIRIIIKEQVLHPAGCHGSPH